MRHSICIAASMAVAAASASVALAQGVGPGSPTDTNHDFSPDGVWYVGGPQTRSAPGGAYRVSLDPHGPYWEKTLLNSPQGPIEGPGILHIHEFIEIVPPVAGGPAQPWTDWHEQFVTPGWGWADFSINIYDFDGFTSDDVMATVPGFSYMISKDTTSIWFDFDPIFPGTDNEPVIIEIWKSLDYNADIGGPYMPGSPIVLREYPTPTPGALALLGVGGLATMRRNR